MNPWLNQTSIHHSSSVNAFRATRSFLAHLPLWNIILHFIVNCPRRIELARSVLLVSTSLRAMLKCNSTCEMPLELDSLFVYRISNNWKEEPPDLQTTMSNEEEKRCRVCAEEMDWTDQQFKPCKCSYQVCVWCWHQIMDMAEKDESEGRCPGCRSVSIFSNFWHHVYPSDNFEGANLTHTVLLSEYRAVTKNCNRKNKPPKAKPKTTEVKDLTNVRVIQRKMAHIVGLPLTVADENVLLRKEYFGQYGKITKISFSRSSTGDIQQFPNDTCSRASFGSAKYWHDWLRQTPCVNPACLYLHTIGLKEDGFGKLQFIPGTGFNNWLVGLNVQIG